jgi:uncharacterized repeat protein (TIGR03803 family)
LYGTTQAGGAGNFGTAFRVTTDGAFTTLVDFSGSGGVARGAVPHELIYAPDGFFYGVTEAGGLMEVGTVFRLAMNGLVTTLVDFTGTTGTRKGSFPVGSLYLTGQVLFGVTQTGGANDLGTIFSVTTNGTWNLVTEFTGVTGNRRGAFPTAGVLLLADGALYGTTTNGGVNDEGTIYRLTLGGTYSLLREFSGPDGAQPEGGLLVGPDGALFGTTASGGVDDAGTVFKVATTDGTAWVHTVIAEFSGESTPSPGASPQATLCTGPNGLMFGTTSGGGPGGFGTIFSITSTGTFASVANFTTASGWRPSGGFVAAGDGTADLIAPIYSGGVNGYGTLLRLRASGTLVVEAAFGSPQGNNPEGGLAQLGQGLFGVTRAGGANNRGTFFSHVPGFGTSLLSSFTVQGGARPEGPLTLRQDGYFYGVAREGGATNRGGIVKLATDGTKSLLASFTSGTGPARGHAPRAPLASGTDGNLYGVTERGGANDQGTIFSVTPDGTLTALHDFAATGPRSPMGGLVRGPDGNFYGTTSNGGAAGAGTVLRFSPGSPPVTIAEFTGTTGALPGSRPTGPLCIALDGTIYGTCSQGGDSGQGSLFRIQTDLNAGKLFAFSSVTGTARGTAPLGALSFGPDGLLYGATASGGTGGGGTFFRVRQLGPHVGTYSAAFAPGSITLRGAVQTGGEAITGSFEYGPSPALGSTTAATLSGGASPVSMTATLTGLEVGSTWYFRALATNPTGSSTGVVRSFVVPGPFDAWRLQYFGDTSIAATADSDVDGIPNLAEYALLRSPTEPDAQVALSPAIEMFAEGRRLSTTVPRDPARSDITIWVEASGSPAGPWTTLAMSAAGNPFSGPGYVGGDSATPGIKTVAIRDIANTTDSPQRFLRVRVALP